MARKALNVDGDLLESAFQTQVVGLLRVYGWTRIYHAPHGGHAAGPGARRVAGGQLPEGTGFPDLIALKGPRLLVAELKAERGRIGPGQREWLEAFLTLGGHAAAARHALEVVAGPTPPVVGARIEAHLWRPSDWDQLHAVIRGDEEHRHDLDPAR